MRNRRSSADTAVATLDPTLPAGATPLRWGPPWPSVDAQLHISGVRGTFAYHGHVEFGNKKWLQVIPWGNTLWNAALGWYEAPLERVFVLAEGEAQP